MTSIRDIARRARVSIGTVDRVLHNRGRVAKETRVKVLRIISRLDYRPNIYARNLSLGKTFTFGVLMPRLPQDSGYWQLAASGIDRARRELEPYQVRVKYFHFNRYSEKSFTLAARACLGDDLDGLLIAPVLQQAAQEMISREIGNLPYGFFDSTIPGTHSLTSIGQDPFQSGVVAANLMRKIVNPKGDIALVKVIPDDFHISERVRGFTTAMQEQPDVRLHHYEADSRDPADLSYLLPQRILKESVFLAGIFVTNAWTHPIAKYFQKQEAEKRVRIIGYDLVRENVRHLRNGIIDFLISQRPEMQGYLGILSLHRSVVLRQKVRKRIRVPLDILTADNLIYYQE
jgi:LacI family transcriptional regulator